MHATACMKNWVIFAEFEVVCPVACSLLGVLQQTKKKKKIKFLPQKHQPVLSNVA
jgi:hypothetical protein